MSVEPASDRGTRTTADAGVRDFWAVYDAHHEELTRRVSAQLANDPDLGPLVGASDDEAAHRAAQTSHELARRALLFGEWAPYEAQIREQGATYGRAGLPYGAWPRAISALRSELLPLLLQAYSGDPGGLAGAMHAMSDFFDRAATVLGEEYIRVKEAIILQQASAIQELSTPVLRLRERLLLMPIIGVIDTHRARQLTEALLEAIHRDRARAAVLDITGVPAVDSKVAQHLIQTVSAARLMGTDTIVTGLSPEVAQSLVTLGLDLSRLRTVGDLEGGIELAERIVAARDSPRGA